jgi:hypothetical protein
MLARPALEDGKIVTYPKSVYTICGSVYFNMVKISTAIQLEHCDVPQGRD